MADRKWIAAFDERQRKQIEFAEVYAKKFAHGADGHNSMLIINRFAFLMDQAEAEEERKAQFQVEGTITLNESRS